MVTSTSSCRSDPAAALRGLAKRGSPDRLAGFVEREKVVPAQIDLAPDLDHVGNICCIKRLGHIAHGARHWR